MAQPMTTDTAQEEDFKEETSQSSWDSLDQEFDNSDGANYSEEPTAKDEPAEADDEAEVSEAVEVPADEPTTEPEASNEPEKAPVEEPAPEVEAKAEPVKEEAKAEEVRTSEPEPYPTQPAITDAQRQELRSQAFNQLTQQYAMSQEQTDAFETNPADVLPQLAANLHLRVYENVVNSIMERLPDTLETVIKSREGTMERENAFFVRWPELKEHREQVSQLAYMWRQMNPRASGDVAREEIGKVAMAALGLTPTLPGTPETPAPAPIAMTPPTTPPVQRTAQKKPSANQYVQLSELWSQEDID